MIVDDHPIIRRGIRDAINATPGLQVVAEASDPAEALAVLKETKPDIATIDISLGRGSGLELIKQLRAEYPDLRMVVVSVHDEELYAERALRAGAAGYIRKSAPADEIVAALRTVLDGGTALTAGMTERLVHQAVHGGAGGQTGVESLSDRELEVFELLGNGLSTRRVAERLCISIKTVETHRENIKHKLGVSNASELTRYAVAWVENPGGTNP